MHQKLATRDYARRNGQRAGGLYVDRQLWMGSGDNWHRLVKSVVIVLSLLAAGIAAAAVNSDWLLTYKGKSTNDVIIDERAADLIDAVVPASLTAEVWAGLHGPPDPVLVDEGRFVVVSACVAHYCLDQGFLWIDVKTNAGVGAYLSGAVSTESGDVDYSDSLLTIGSNAFSDKQIPAKAINALRAWLSEHGVDVGAVRFAGKDDRRVELDPSRFAQNVRFVPDPGGPSFDCKKATGRI